MYTKKSLRKGFTLAEVLITLGIIGVVAALTIPAMMNRTNDKETVTAVKEAYSILSQAYKMVEKDNGDASHWYINSARGDAINLLKTHLKVSDDCTGGKTTCLPTNYEGLEDGSWPVNDGSYPTIVLTNGMSILASGETPSCDDNFGNSLPLQNVCQYFVVDINGLKGPNTHARDLFGFYLTRFGFVPTGGPMQTSDYAFTTDCKNATTSGLGCTAWVITNENLDYRKCRSDISWNGAHTCP